MRLEALRKFLRYVVMEFGALIVFWIGLYGVGIKAAIASGRLSQAQIDASVERVLRAKASVGLHTRRAIDLDAVPALIGGRAHEAAAQEAFVRAMTLVKDDRRQVPLTVARDAPILYLSILDSPSGWQIAAPSRTFIPELKKRWPNVTSVEVSDHTPMSELDLVRAAAPRYGAIVASVFVRSTPGSGRMDLGPELVRLLKDLARITERANLPLVTTFFGNPYVQTKGITLFSWITTMVTDAPGWDTVQP